MASFCTNCAAPLEPAAKFCGACGTGVDPPVVAATPLPTAQVFTAAPGRRYPALRVISVVLKVSAVLTAGGALIFGLAVGLIPFGPFLGSYPGGLGLGIIIAGIFYGLFQWASAEMIHVLLDIEENTRHGARDLG